MRRLRHSALLLITGSMSAFFAGEAFAQCSGQGRGGASMAAMSGSVTPVLSSGPANALAFQQALAYQQQRALAMQQGLLQQQQLAALRTQSMQFLAQQQYDQQRELMAGRLARAEAKRARRAERIGARLQSRGADSTGGSSSTILAAARIKPSSDEDPLR